MTQQRPYIIDKNITQFQNFNQVLSGEFLKIDFTHTKIVTIKVILHFSLDNTH